MARPRSDIAPRIVHAARARFLHDGVDGASLRQIAQDAGTSIGMVYYYFPTKDDLFLAVVEETYAAVMDKMTAALAPAAPVEERIARLYRMLGALTDDEITTVRLVVREALVSSNRLSRLLDRFQRGHLPLIGGVLFEGLQTGHIDPRLPFPVLIAATFAMGAAAQLLLRIAGDRLPLAAAMDRSALADQLVYTLFHGIGAPTAPAVPAVSTAAPDGQPAVSDPAPASETAAPEPSPDAAQGAAFRPGDPLGSRAPPRRAGKKKAPRRPRGGEQGPAT